MSSTLGNRTVVLVSVLVLLTVTACQTVRYFSSDRKSHSTAAEAIAATQEEILTRLAAVDPSTERVGGATTLVLPSERTIQVFIGDIQIGDFKEFALETTHLYLEEIVQAVEKSAMFDDVTTRRADDPEFEIVTGDYKIWPEFNYEEPAVWFLSDGTPGTKVEVTGGEELVDSKNRSQFFITKLLEALRTLDPGGESSS